MPDVLTSKKVCFLLTVLVWPPGVDGVLIDFV